MDKLAREGFDVTLAVNGETGLDKIRSEKPDLVLMDLVLPRLTGLQVLEAVKNDPDESLRSIPVFVVTNLGQESDLQKATALGAAAYFVKANTLFSAVLAKVRDTLGIE
jgi:twitching motility two-component system response regulator PilH